jgi:hypothetical protein
VVLNTDYTDWLAIHLRKIFKNQNSLDSLVKSYLENNNFKSFSEKKHFFKLLQFLSFIRKFKGLKKSIKDQVYYVIEFRFV